MELFGATLEARRIQSIVVRSFGDRTTGHLLGEFCSPQFMRRAIIGSMREARRAGKKPAAQATLISKRIIITKVAGSVGSVWNSRDDIHQATAKDAIVPKPIPNVTKVIVFERTPNCRCPAVAPRAMRIPISCVCRATKYEMTP